MKRFIQAPILLFVTLLISGLARAQTISVTGGSLAGTESTELVNGVVAVFGDSGGGSLGTADYTATIDWGDSTSTSTGNVVRIGGTQYSVRGTHTYAEYGTYSVVTTITSSDSRTGSGTGSAVIADASVSVTGVTIDRSERFISSVFVDEAAQNPTASQLASWRTKLSAKGATRYSVAKSMLASAPFTSSLHAHHVQASDHSSFITQLIQDYLGRAATSDEQNFYEKVFRASLGETVVKAIVLSSGEYYTKSGIGITLYPEVSGQIEGGGAFAGMVASFVDDNDDSNRSDFTTLITWADGTTSSGSIEEVSTGNYRVFGAHNFTTAGTKSNTVKVTSVGTATDTATTKIIVGGSTGACYKNISSGLKIRKGSITIDPKTRIGSMSVTITNTRKTDFSAPLYLTVSSLGSKSRLINSEGVTNCRQPLARDLITVPLRGKKLAVGASASATLKFLIPTGKQAPATIGALGAG